MKTMRWWLAAGCLVVWASDGRCEQDRDSRLANRLQDGPAVLLTFGGDVEDASFGFGYQAAYRHTPLLSVEFSAFWQQDESVDLGGQAPAVPPGSTIDLDVWAFALTARAGYEPFQNTHAYAGGGAGVYRLDVENGAFPAAGGSLDADIGTDLGWHVVAGMEWTFHRHWQLFGEYRFVWYEDDLEVRFVPPGGPGTTSRGEFSYDHGVLRLGLNYRF